MVAKHVMVANMFAGMKFDIRTVSDMQWYLQIPGLCIVDRSDTFLDLV